MEHNINQPATDEEVKLLVPPETVETVEGGEAEHEEQEDGEGEASAKRDAELEEAETDEERTAIRERRREERRSRNSRRKEKLETLENQNRMLEESLQRVMVEVASLKSSTFAQTMGAVDTEIQRAQQAAQHFMRVEADAISKANGPQAAQARMQADQFRDRARQLSEIKAQATHSANQPAPLNPAMVEKATAFAKRHNWYRGPHVSDPDSKVMTALDTSLTAEGWDPTSDAYWQELEARAGKYLPHRIGGSDSGSGERDRTKPRQSVAGASSGSSGSGSGKGYQLSAERVKAMKDAGIWDDPKRRDAMIKRYQADDAAHKS